MLSRGRMYDEFIRLLFLHAHREASALANELSEESHQFRFLHVSCFTNLKGVVGLIMTKVSVIRISIPLDLLSRPCVPLPHFLRSRRPTPCFVPSSRTFSSSFCLTGTWCGGRCTKFEENQTNVQWVILPGVSSASSGDLRSDVSLTSTDVRPDVTPKDPRRPPPFGGYTRFSWWCSWPTRFVRSAQ